MNIDLVVGSATTLAGALLGGTISFVLNRQQLNDAKVQRAEEAVRAKAHRSEDRRFSAYSDLLTHGRAYRNAIRPELAKLRRGSDGDRIGALAGAADAATSLVFLLLESGSVFDACRAIMVAIQASQVLLRETSEHIDESRWRQVNDEMSAALRIFEAAARDELEVGGAEKSWILERRRPQRAPSDES